MIALKKVLPITLILLSFSVTSFAQEDLRPISTSQDAGMIFNLPSPKRDTVGTFYLNEEWKNGTVILSSNIEIENYPLRLDLRFNGLELKTDKGIKFIQANIIREFTLEYEGSKSRKFINADHYLNRTIGEKIMEELVEGVVGLYKHSETYIQKANYNPALNVGTRNDAIKFKEVYYFYKDYKLIEVKSKIKKNKELLGDDFDKVESFISSNKLKMKQESDLIKITQYINSL